MRLATAVDPRSAEFAANKAAMTALVGDLNAHLAKIAAGGSVQAVAKHRERGRLLARERIDRLLDPGAPFLELSALAAHGLYGSEVPAAGIVTGVGTVAGRPCVIVANDPTVKGGTYYPLTVKKHLRAQEVAAQNHLTGTTLAAFSTTRRTCPPPASPR